MSILEVQNLHVQLITPRGIIHAVNGVDFELEKGEILALVGESGSGKSVTARSIMGLLPGKESHISAEKITLNEIDLTKQNGKQYNMIRGKEISMIFQNPLTALDPAFKVGKQLINTIIMRKRIPKKAAKDEARYWLDSVGITDIDRVMNAYPHSLSGGMRQRIMIALAISCQPQVIIADEPTTALDASIQKKILELLKKINKEQNISIIIITHDFGVVANLSDKVAVMYAGKIVEYGKTNDILTSPKHPYTQGLIHSIPKIGQTKQFHRLPQIDGSPPDLFHLPKGCSFADRCKEASEKCLTHMPEKIMVGKEHLVTCLNREVQIRDNTG